MNRVPRRLYRRLVLLGWLVLVGAALAIAYFLLQAMIDELAFTPPRLLGVAGTGVLVALLVGSFELLYLPSRRGERLRRRPFPVLLGTRAAVITACVICGLSLGNALFNPDVGIGYWTGRGILVDTGVSFALAAAVVFVVQVRSVVGPRVLTAFVLGRYFRPVRERRVFLFLDLADSTRLAERLGDEGTHALISRFFFDIAGPVLEHGGETHRYIGDQVVVTWPEARGLEAAACLECVFAIADEIEARREHYEHEFSVVPRFRAGLHCGPVVAGECGDEKREIVYLCNTVNTAARIEAMCRELDRPVLASGDLVAALTVPSHLRAEPLGTHRLRGREQPVGLFAVDRRADDSG